MGYEQEYAELAREVKNFDTMICKELKKNHNSELEKYYKGAAILMSPLHHKCKVLVLGINPGDGYYKANKNEPLHCFKEEKKHEYFEDGYDIALGEGLKNVFDSAGDLALLEKSVKSNFYYFLSANLRDF